MFKKQGGRKLTAACILLVIFMVGCFLMSDDSNDMRQVSSDGGVPLSPVNQENVNAATPAMSLAPVTPGKESLPLMLSDDHHNAKVSLKDVKPKKQAPKAFSPVKDGSFEANDSQARDADLRRKAAILPGQVGEVNTINEVDQSASSAEGLQLASSRKTIQDLGLSTAESKDNTGKSLSGTFTDPTTGMEFVFIKGGCFQMGSDHELANEKRAHEVCLDDFYLGRYEVPQMQWKILMGRNFSYFRGNRYPVKSISWEDTQKFIRILNSRSSKVFRLPTEAEWEYAARGGDTQETYTGTRNDAFFKNFAWHDVNSDRKTHAVGMKKPNRCGLYDMNGKVWELCNDWYGEGYYAQSQRNNPQGPSTGAHRVIRGGEWGLPAQLARATYREGVKPNTRKNDIGFRLAL